MAADEPQRGFDRFHADIAQMLRECCCSDVVPNAEVGPEGIGSVTFQPGSMIRDYNALEELLHRTHHCNRRIAIGGPRLSGIICNAGDADMPDEWKAVAVPAKPDPVATFRAYLASLPDDVIREHIERVGGRDDKLEGIDKIKDDLRFQ